MSPQDLEESCQHDEIITFVTTKVYPLPAHLKSPSKQKSSKSSTRTNTLQEHSTHNMRQDYTISGHSNRTIPSKTSRTSPSTTTRSLLLNIHRLLLSVPLRGISLWWRVITLLWWTLRRIVRLLRILRTTALLLLATVKVFCGHFATDERRFSGVSVGSRCERGAFALRDERVAVK